MNLQQKDDFRYARTSTFVTVAHIWNKSMLQGESMETVVFSLQLHSCRLNKSLVYVIICSRVFEYMNAREAEVVVNFVLDQNGTKICVRACVRACVNSCVCMCLRVCGRACACVCA